MIQSIQHRANAPYQAVHSKAALATAKTEANPLSTQQAKAITIQFGKTSGAWINLTSEYPGLNNNGGQGTGGLMNVGPTIAKAYKAQTYINMNHTLAAIPVDKSKAIAQRVND
ncbi:MAG: hypothetical protein SFU25_05870, partial [Candidatus Caenarcaniphilales bacterium]|nr:hypothetical protein [Candidatus Caenarcaniphilales bacterium]